MQPFQIKYSKQKNLFSLIIIALLIFAGIYMTFTSEWKWGLVCIAIFAYDGMKKYKLYSKGELLIEFSDAGIKTADETIEWKFIKNISIKDDSDEEPQIVIRYTDAESLEDYYEELKEFPNAHFDKEEFDKNQNLRKEIDTELGIKNTYFEEFKNENEADEIFKKQDSDASSTSNAEAELDYDTLDIPLESTDVSLDQIKSFLNTIRNKFNTKLP